MVLQLGDWVRSQKFCYEMLHRVSDIIHSEELYNLYGSPNTVRLIKSRRVNWIGHVACMGEMRSVYKLLVGKPVGNRPLRRPKHREEDNIRMDLKEVG
jgi:hypothetical protein